MRPFLLLCPDRKQFVMLLAREPDKKVRQQPRSPFQVGLVYC